MKFIKSAAVVALTSGILSASLFAADTAKQTVTFEVLPINELAFDGDIELTIDSADAGAAPTSETSSGTYAITTNQTDRKITAILDEAMPDGVTLEVLLAAPNGASSSQKALGATAVDVVTGISTLNQSGLSVTYTLSATAAAGVVPSDTREVTYTIIAQ